MHFTRARFLATGAAFLAAAALPIAAPAQQAKPLIKVSFRLDWKASGQHSPFFLGKERGFFAAEGIDLNIISGSGSADAVKQLGAGSVDMALADALVIVQAAAQQVPVKAVGAYYQRTPMVMISPKAKPVTQPQQLLSGVKLGAKRASATFQGLTAMLNMNNIDPKKVSLVDVGFGVQPLLVGQVDALMGFTMNEAIEAESAGMPVHELLLADNGVNAYGLVLATSDRFLSGKPDLVRGFMRAARRSVEAANADKPAAVAALAKSASEVDTAREVKVLGKTVPFLLAKPNDTASFGTHTQQGWQQTIATAKRVGLVESEPALKDLFAPGVDR
jgi:NitT/TauT family transport system substrate-binding protein